MKSGDVVCRSTNCELGWMDGLTTYITFTQETAVCFLCETDSQCFLSIIHYCSITIPVCIILTINDEESLT